MRRTDSGQLTFVFADSPKGGDRAANSGAPEGKAWLLHIANGKQANEPAAQAGETTHLLEQAADRANLARGTT